MVAKKKAVVAAPKRKYTRKVKEVTWFQKAVKSVKKFFSKGK